MDKQIKKILFEAEEKFTEVKDNGKLERLYIEYFGKNSPLNKLTHKIPQLDPVLRPNAGKNLNKAKIYLQKLYISAKKRVSALKTQFTPAIDVTAPGDKKPIGHIHLVSQ